MALLWSGRSRRWRKRATVADLRELSAAIDDGMDLKLRRVTGHVERVVRENRPPPHFIPAPLELPLAYVQQFRDAAAWQFALGPLMANQTCYGTLRVERHGTKLLLRFEHNGAQVVTFELVGV